MRNYFHQSLNINFVCLQGPGWLWAIDGHEKLAQPYGLYIYGCIDTFSRKILSMTVLPDKKKETIDRWLMKTIYNVQGL